MAILRPLRYQVHDGRILTWSLEAHVTDHCNLRCAHCCTLSPELPARCVSPEDLSRDLSLAARGLAPAVFKLTGGEPTLHPRLAECAERARESGIAQRVSLTSNGFRLADAADALFDALDELTLSLYTSAPLGDSRLERIARRCEDHRVALRVKWIDRFARMDAEPPYRAPGETLGVYRRCWLRERCHMIREGRFYACTRPPHLAVVLERRGEPGAASLAEVDGVSLDQPDLAARLQRYLEREEPLAACGYCLGGDGAFEPHLQRGRAPLGIPA